VRAARAAPGFLLELARRCCRRENFSGLARFTHLETRLKPFRGSTKPNFQCSCELILKQRDERIPSREPSTARFPTILLRTTEMTHTAQTVPQILTRNGRPTKFTPERVQQIKNLVERGKSRDEIAELLDVTVGSLAVTCSRLGISLRRISLDNGVGSTPRRKLGRSEEAGQAPNHGSRGVAPSQVTPAQFCPHLALVGEARQSSEQHEERPNTLEADLARYTIKMQYKGAERTTELPLTEEVMGTLALEAQLQGLRIGELITEIIVATMKKDLLQVVLGRRLVPASDPAPFSLPPTNRDVPMKAPGEAGKVVCYRASQGGKRAGGLP
jgi:hypothetical protein